MGKANDTHLIPDEMSAAYCLLCVVEYPVCQDWARVRDGLNEQTVSAQRDLKASLCIRTVSLALAHFSKI